MIAYFKKFKLYQQLIFLILLSVLTTVSVITFTTQFFVKDYSLQLEKSLESEILNNYVTSQLLAASTRLEGLTIAHAYWTELVDATQNNDVAWIKQNATDYLITDPLYGVDQLCLSNTDTKYTEYSGDLSPEIYESLFLQTPKEALKIKATSYLVQQNKKLYVVTLSALTNTERTKSYGYLAYGSLINESLVGSLKKTYSAKANIDLRLAQPELNRISPFNAKNILNITQSHFTLTLSNIQLVNSVVTQANQLLIIILSILFISALILLVALLKLSSNFDKSIRSIQSITYHDYTQKIHLDFSKDFLELSQCINNLSTELSLRDQNINQKYIEIISILIKTLEEVDRYTKGHSERVSHYSVELARAIGYSDLEAIRLSGLLHDIGKIKVDIKILNKPGALTPEEFAEIKKHPLTAYSILDMSEVFNPIKEIVKYHHEKVNGLGYPEGLTGDAIPLGAKIIAIADVFDSLTSERSYRDPLSIEEALEIIKKDSGSHFDPSLVKIFVQIAEKIYQDWSMINTSPEVSELAVDQWTPTEAETVTIDDTL